MHPHVRGDNYREAKRRQQEAGAPPRAWGQHYDTTRKTRARGVDSPVSASRRANHVLQRCAGNRAVRGGATSVPAGGGLVRWSPKGRSAPHWQGAADVRGWPPHRERRWRSLREGLLAGGERPDCPFRRRPGAAAMAGYPARSRCGATGCGPARAVLVGRVAPVPLAPAACSRGMRRQTAVG